MEDVLEILWLAGDEEVEAPAATEVCDNDGVDGKRREELLPRRLQELRSTINGYKTERHARVLTNLIQIT